MKLTQEQREYFAFWGYKCSLRNRKGKIYLTLKTNEDYQTYPHWYQWACIIVNKEFPVARNTSASETDMTFRVNPW